MAFDHELGIPGPAKEPYVHPLTERINQALEAAGKPVTRRERRKTLRKLKRLFEKHQKKEQAEAAEET